MKNPFRRKALYYSEEGGASITVSPGDALFDAISNAADDTPLSVRALAQRHWAVSACVGQIARAFAGLDVADAMRSPDGDQPTRDQKVAPLLRPHLHRIALDLARFGEFIAAYAVDGEGTPRELVPLRPDEVELRDDGKYHIGDASYPRSRVLHVAHELPAVSPLDSLRSLLEEDISAEKWRREAWRFAPRGMVERPAEAPEWTQAAMERFIASLTSRNRKPAGVDLLEEGMKFQPVELPNAENAQYIAGRKLASEAVASVLGVQGALLATGSDKQLSQARRQLIAGPVSDYARLVGEASETLAVQLYGAQALNGRIRPIFDIEAALRREHEEPNITTAAVGKWRTPNEQRRLEGLPPVAGGDVLAPPGEPR
jgi:phage portal protein BeeE